MTTTMTTMTMTMYSEHHATRAGNTVQGAPINYVTFSKQWSQV